MLGRIRYRLATAIFSIVSLNVTPAFADTDPLETINRAVHRFNQSVYDLTDQVFGTDAMRGWVPNSVRTYLINFYGNMTEPVTAMASLFRGDFEDARTATRRFIINLTLGYGGLVDRASEYGIRRSEAGLSDTLCRLGVPDGPYLVVPFYGPATVTDLLGSALAPVAGYYAFGLPFAAYRAGYGLTTMVDDNAEGGFQALRPVAYEAQRQDYLRRRAVLCGSEPADDRITVDKGPNRPASGETRVPVAAQGVIEPRNKPLLSDHHAILAAVPSM